MTPSPWWWWMSLSICSRHRIAFLTITNCYYCCCYCHNVCCVWFVSFGTFSTRLKAFLVLVVPNMSLPTLVMQVFTYSSRSCQQRALLWDIMEVRCMDVTTFQLQCFQVEALTESDSFLIIESVSLLLLSYHISTYCFYSCVVAYSHCVFCCCCCRQGIALLQYDDSRNCQDRRK